MSRTVNCVILGTEAEGIDRPVYPGELGQRIYDNVSKIAWQRWLGHQTMLINEYRLTPSNPRRGNSSNGKWRSLLRRRVREAADFVDR